MKTTAPILTSGRFETPHEEYPPERRGDSWQNCVKSEVVCSRPYWRKSTESFAPGALDQHNKQMSASRLALEEAMKANDGKFIGWQIDVYSSKAEKFTTATATANEDLVALHQELSVRHGKSVAEVFAAIANVEKAFTACQTLRIPFQAVVKDELPKDSQLFGAAQEAVVQFRQMDFGLGKVSGVAAVVAHFEKNPTPGAQLVLVDGPWICGTARERIRGLGAVVKLEGAYGNRLATFVEFNNCSKGSKRPKRTCAGGKTLPPVTNPKDWRNKVSRELDANAPYWKKHFSSLTYQERAAQAKSNEDAFLALAEVMRDNQGMFSGAQIAAYESDNSANALITKAIAACSALRIPFECVVLSPIPWGCSKEVTAFRMMDMGLDTFSTLEDLANDFKSKKAKTGDQAVLTGGSKDLATAANDIKQRGVKIELQGVHGNRVATFLGEYTKRIETIHSWNKSGRAKNDFTNSLSSKIGDLTVGGPAVFVEGNHNTLIRDLKEAFGPASCSVRKTADRTGWMITLKEITKSKKTAAAIHQ
jgi:hypothetical protein